MKIESDKLFGCMDSETEQLPLLTDEEKERMFNMSERKFNNDNSGGSIPEDKNVVSGVERYRRPVLRRIAAAAAAVLLIGGAGTGVYIARNGNLYGSEIAITDTNIESPETEDDYQYIARSLLEGYAVFMQYIECHETLPGTVITLYIDGFATELGRFVNDDINSVAELREFGEQYLTAEFIGDNFNLPDDDKSQYQDGQSISAYDFYSPDANSLFFNYNGKLYTYAVEPVVQNIYWDCDTLEISDMGQTEFTAKVTLIKSLSTDEQPVEMPLVITFTKNEATGAWQISHQMLDSDKVNTQESVEMLDEIPTAKQYSDRLWDLEFFLYERPFSSEEYVTFNVVIDGQTVERKYYRKSDQEPGFTNEIWNAVSIDGLYNFGSLIMDELLFEVYYGSILGKDVSGYSQGDVIFDDGSDPKFIEYNGDLYINPVSVYTADTVRFGPFTEEPVIVSSTQNEIMFDRTIASNNGDELTYRFDLTRDGATGTWRIINFYAVEAEGIVLPAEDDTSDIRVKELKGLIDDYQTLADALAPHTYVNEDVHVTYHVMSGSGESEISSVFSPFEHPDFTDYDKVDQAIENVFSDNFIEYNFPNRLCNIHYEEDDDIPVDVYLEEDMMEYSPIACNFVYINEVLYKNVTRSSFPYHSELDYSIEVTSQSDDAMSIVVHYVLDEAKTYSNNPDTRFNLVKVDGKWKIDAIFMNDYYASHP